MIIRTLMSMLKFSRDQERESDIAAARALQKRYKHISGAKNLFSLFESEAPDSKMMIEMFSTHPHNEDRWQNLKVLAKESGWNIDGHLTPKMVFDDSKITQ